MDKLCSDGEAWVHYGSIGLKSGINFLWGPGVEPPPPGQQVENKHHTTTHGEIMVGGAAVSRLRLAACSCPLFISN